MSVGGTKDAVVKSFLRAAEPNVISYPTSYLQVGMKVSVCEQRFGQLSQKRLEQRGHVVGVEVSGLQVNVGSTVEELLQGLLPDAVPRHPKQTLHVQI